MSWWLGSTDSACCLSDGNAMAEISSDMIVTEETFENQSVAEKKTQPRKKRATVVVKGAQTNKEEQSTSSDPLVEVDIPLNR